MAEFDYEVVNGRKIRVRPQEVVSEIDENGYFFLLQIILQKDLEKEKIRQKKADTIWYGQSFATGLTELRS